MSSITGKAVVAEERRCDYVNIETKKTPKRRWVVCDKAVQSSDKLEGEAADPKDFASASSAE